MPPAGAQRCRESPARASGANPHPAPRPACSRVPPAQLPADHRRGGGQELDPALGGLAEALGLIGGPLMISSAVGQILGVNDLYSAWSLIALLPIFAWEFSLGLWLVFKGFRRSAPLFAAETTADRQPRAIAGTSVVAATEAGAA